MVNIFDFSFLNFLYNERVRLKFLKWKATKIGEIQIIANLFGSRISLFPCYLIPMFTDAE